MSLSNDTEQTVLHDKILKGQGADAWEYFTNWIHCICVVTFDLELGQALEVSAYMLYTLRCLQRLESFAERFSSPC